MNFGIVGYGAFGEFLSNILVKFGNVYFYDKRKISKELPGRIIQADFEEVAACPVVIIASGLFEMDLICRKLRSLVAIDTVVLDVCSVKIQPIKIMKKYLSGKCQLVATHPLFGPQTTTGTIVAGQKIIVCPIEIKDFSGLKSLLRDYLRLEVIEMDPAEHDQQMAWVQGLTFFIGKGLLALDPPKSPLTTGYYQKLLELVEMERPHTVELFETVQRGNQYAPEIRSKLIRALSDIDKDLINGKE